MIIVFFALIDYDENLLILKEDRNKKNNTENFVFSKIRKGQSIFREKLLKNFKQCPITKINDRRLLVASHIKPWYLSDESERMDIDNGFILSSLFDTLFDVGLITFSSKSEILISKELSSYNLKKIDIHNKQKVKNLPISIKKQEYLEYHGDKIFLK